MHGLELTIFLSGTMEDLREERTALRERGDLLPMCKLVAAEDWGARPRPPRELCIDAAQKSDVYLGLYGGRYGYIPRGEEISITEWEFDTARRAGKPALIYSRRGRKGPKQQKFLKRVFDFEIGYNRRPEFENCDQLVAWVKEDLITLMEDLIEEPGGDLPPTRDPLIYVKCRLNLAFRAKEGGQWEHAVRHCQWVLNQGVWNLEAHELALRELQSLYIAEERWESAIEAVWGSTDLLPLTGLPTDELSGLERKNFQDLARIYALRAKSDSERGNQGEAVDSYREAGQIYRKIGDWQGVRAIQSALAETYEKWAEACAGVHRWADAVDHYHDALAVYEELGNPAKIALVCYCLGQMRKEQRRSREALNCFERCLEFSKGKGTDDRFLVHFDDIVLSAHDEIINRRLVREGEFHHAVLQLCKKAYDLFIAGRTQDAIVSAQRALNLSEKRQGQKSILASRLCLASLLVKTDQPEEAIKQYEMAVELTVSLGGEKVRNELSEQLEKAVQKYRGDLRTAEKQGNLKARNKTQGYIDRLEELRLRGYT